jgi:5'-deoxynucleotidase YfbR-like HD superfamily hydrolase
MSKLQYTIEEAYTGNVSVCKFKDSKNIDHDIVSNYALEGYIECLENEGYERAYDVDSYKQKWEEAKKLEEEAHTAYINALCHPLMKTDR